LKYRVKNIKNFDGYTVNENGEVVSYKKKTPTVLIGGKNRRGYHQIFLRKNGKTIGKMRHRLVAEAFIEKPKDKWQVNHKDGNKNNNHVSNLEWMTNQENTQHAFDTGLKFGMFGTDNPKTVLDDMEILTIKTFLGYMPQWKIAEHYGVTQANISSIKSGKAWSWMNVIDYKQHNKR
jgi:hypothetical protein